MRLIEACANWPMIISPLEPTLGFLLMAITNLMQTNKDLESSTTHSGIPPGRVQGDELVRTPKVQTFGSNNS